VDIYSLYLRNGDARYAIFDFVSKRISYTHLECITCGIRSEPMLDSLQHPIQIRFIEGSQEVSDRISGKWGGGAVIVNNRIKAFWENKGYPVCFDPVEVLAPRGKGVYPKLPLEYPLFRCRPTILAQIDYSKCSADDVQSDCPDCGTTSFYHPAYRVEGKASMFWSPQGAWYITEEVYEELQREGFTNFILEKANGMVL
jgi:hypothetical protein